MVRRHRARTFYLENDCIPGVIKTYQLTFETASSMHALFKPEMAKSVWSISSRVLREFVDHFGPKTEQLDIYSKDGRATFTSYTEKIVAGKGMKHPYPHLQLFLAMDLTLNLKRYSNSHYIRQLPSIPRNFVSSMSKICCILLSASRISRQSWRMQVS